MSEYLVETPDENTEKFEPPGYELPGRIFVHITNVLEPGTYNRYEIEIEEADVDTGVFWIEEGVGYEYWFDQHIEVEHPGYYVIEGIKGEYVRGNGWTTDDDEYWDYERIRKATPDEIMFGLDPLIPAQQNECR